MSTQAFPTAEIILTNEHDMIGAGYDYGLRSGPNNAFDTGSFGLPASDIRRLRFDHCFVLTPESVPWSPSPEDLKGFFRFVLSKESGEVVTDVAHDFWGDPKANFENMVHYITGHSGIYNIPAEREKTPSGRYHLTCFANNNVVACAPVRFYLEIELENIWMYSAPTRFLMMVPFVEGTVTREELNPAAPPPTPPPSAS